MKVHLALWAACAAVGLPCAHVSGQQSTGVLGKWIGESRCVGSHPACHDEQVVYQIDSAGPRRLLVQGSRLAGPDTVAMGALTCAASETQLAFTCLIPAGTWRFAVVQGHLEGILELPDSTVMRRVFARRAQPNPRQQRAGARRTNATLTATS